MKYDNLMTRNIERQSAIGAVLFNQKVLKAAANTGVCDFIKRG
jgi:hypothetical protein